MPVPQAYFDFVMQYAPYVYVVPSTGPDLMWSKAAFSAGFAVDFLFEAYFDRQFDSQSAEIETKISELADFIVSQQCTDPQRLAHGGFKSTQTSSQYYAIDACRTIPALLKAYELTSTQAYLDAAILAGNTFLFNMQRQPSQLGVHDQYHGGFATGVSLSDEWLPDISVECLYGLVGLQMLCESDPEHRGRYEEVMADLAAFCRAGVEGCFDHFCPKPTGDGGWHRTDQAERVVYDDTLAYALLGLYCYEGWTPTVQRTYEFLSGAGACRQYPAYNPAVCWAGYINAQTKTPSCDYYDGVTAGILAPLRRDHDRAAYQYSAQTVQAHTDQFMYWGVKHADYAPLVDQQATATVCWLGQFLLSYEAPLTRFTQVLNSKGENLTLYPIATSGENAAYGGAVDFKAVVVPSKLEETLLEPGYITTDYLTLHAFVPLRIHDKVRRGGTDYEILTVQDYRFKGETAYRKVTCRRLLAQ
jgi:hypothetical protein